MILSKSFFILEKNYINRDCILKYNIKDVRFSRIFLDLSFNLKLKNNIKFETLSVIDKIIFFEEFIGQKPKIELKHNKSRNISIFDIWLKINLTGNNLINFMFYYLNILNVSYANKYGSVPLEYIVSDDKFTINFLNFTDKYIINGMNRNLNFREKVLILLKIKNFDNIYDKIIRYRLNSVEIK